MKDNYWIEIKSPTVRGKKKQTIAIRCSEGEAVKHAQNLKRGYVERGHVNVSVKVFEADLHFIKGF